MLVAGNVAVSRDIQMLCSKASTLSSISIHTDALTHIERTGGVILKCARLFVN